MALLQMSKTMDEHKSSNVGAVGGAQKMSDAVDAAVVDRSSFYQYDRHGNVYHHHTRQFGEELLFDQRRDEHMNARFKENNIYEGLALSDTFLASYYSNVSTSFTQLKTCLINVAYVLTKALFCFVCNAIIHFKSTALSIYCCKAASH